MEKIVNTQLVIDFVYCRQKYCVHSCILSVKTIITYLYTMLGIIIIIC